MAQFLPQIRYRGSHGMTLGKRLFAGFVGMVIVVFGGGIGYYFIGDGRWAFGDCLYMTVITVTTVGYGEILDGMATTPYARGFTTILLVVGTGILVVFAPTVAALILGGGLQN